MTVAILAQKGWLVLGEMCAKTDASTQTWISQIEEHDCVFGFTGISEDETTDIEIVSVSSETVSTSSEDDTELSNESNWPPFPRDYWNRLHSAHHRWGVLRARSTRSSPASAKIRCSGIGVWKSLPSGLKCASLSCGAKALGRLCRFQWLHAFHIPL